MKAKGPRQEKYPWEKISTPDMASLTSCQANNIRVGDEAIREDS